MRQCALNVRHMPTGKRSFHTTKLREPDPESSRGGSGQFPFLVPRPRGSIKRRSTMKYEKEKNLAIRKGAAPRRRYYLPDHGNFIFNCSDSATSEIKAPDKILKENRARHLLDESRRKHDKRMARLEQTHRRACRDTQKFYAKKYGTKSERLSRMSKSRLPFQPQTQLTHRRPATLRELRMIRAQESREKYKLFHKPEDALVIRERRRTAREFKTTFNRVIGTSRPLSSFKAPPRLVQTARS
ncbi:hypothetical protein AAMO2058_001457300 [Amorphochlora amoebiformis]